MKNLRKKHFILIGIWFLTLVLQSVFTGLHSDESYYWMYSQNLDWGYFDHPPMVALCIYIGHLLLPGEIGVRLVFILLSTTTFTLILNELNEKKDVFFVGIFMLSFPLIHTHIAGFMAIPDIPLLFFTTIFILGYRRFLENPNWKISTLLAVVLAAMIYSKYHAFLIIGFTVLSNLRLFKSKYFYGILILTIILLLPHIFWQITNEFPTFKYHLIERAKPLQIKYVFPYILSQLAIAGPLTGILIFWKLSRFKPKNQFNKTLIFNIVGFYLALLIISFKNRIEAHWVAAIIPMLIIVSYPLISNDFKFKLWFKRLTLPILVILILYRIYLAFDIIPNVGHLKITFYNREASALEIKEKAKGTKVGFYNNYAAASNYIFYTGDSIVHLSTPSYRFCQYDLWDDEKYANGESLFCVQPKGLNPPNLVKTATGQEKGFFTIEELQSLKNLFIQIENFNQSEYEITFNIILENKNDLPIYTDHTSEPVIAFMQDKEEIESIDLFTLLHRKEIMPGESIKVNFLIRKDKLISDSPIAFYTRTKENIRGEIVSVRLLNN